MLDNRIEQIVNIFRFAGVGLLEIAGSPAVSAGSVQYRKIQCMLFCAKFHQQIKDLLVDLVSPFVVAVHLVDNRNRGQPSLQRLRKHVPRLRHYPFECIHQKQHAVCHHQHALDLAGEIRVAGGVDDIDVVIIALAVDVVDRAVLGQDRNPALAFERIGIKYAFAGEFTLSELARLVKQLVDQRGLTVVDVGDDSYITYVGALHGYSRELNGSGENCSTY